MRHGLLGREAEAIVADLPKLMPDYKDLNRDIYWYEQRLAGKTAP